MWNVPKHEGRRTFFLRPSKEIVKHAEALSRGRRETAVAETPDAADLRPHSRKHGQATGKTRRQVRGLLDLKSVDQVLGSEGCTEVELVRLSAGDGRPLHRLRHVDVGRAVDRRSEGSDDRYRCRRREGGVGGAADTADL